MRKKLDENAMQNELSASAFFKTGPPEAPRPPAATDTHKTSDATGHVAQVLSPSQQHGQKASKLASVLAPYPADEVESIRRSVKSQGKEVSFLRVTPEEKAALADIIYTYRRQGLKTSENEVNRIALNYLIDDYKANGQNSLLAQVLDALAA